MADPIQLPARDRSFASPRSVLPFIVLICRPPCRPLHATRQATNALCRCSPADCDEDDCDKDLPRRAGPELRFKVRR